MRPPLFATPPSLCSWYGEVLKEGHTPPTRPLELVGNANRQTQRPPQNGWCGALGRGLWDFVWFILLHTPLRSYKPYLSRSHSQNQPARK